MTVSIKRRTLLKLLGLGAITGFMTACNGESSAKWKQGARFPDVELSSLEGTTVSLAAFSGTSLILNFWASWCDPCRREMPSLQKLSTLFSPGDLLVVGINVDSDINLAREFILNNRLTFPMLSDKDMKLSNEILRIPGFPMTYLLTRERTIARIVVGARNWVEPQSIEEIESLLKVRRIKTV